MLEWEVKICMIIGPYSTRYRKIGANYDVVYSAA